ncbi:MAG: ATPase, partial [Bacteroidota bacterium]|nr:ATPase [Bacteroidota bacterium]
MEKNHSHVHAHKHEPTTNAAGEYYCPMHCEGEKVYDKPGNCPVCGMHLVQQATPDMKKDTQLKSASNASLKGEYYCPMHCEVDKTYDKPGDCPVCGMHLVKAPSAPSPRPNGSAGRGSTSAGGDVRQYTCPMHPEIIRDAPGSCPICGMDLVPMQPAEDEEDTTYKALLKKFKVAVFFTLPILIIAMSDMLPGNPLNKIFSQQVWNWIQFALSLPVIFYATWMFFQRAWTSIVTWNLNMFTLIGIGTGVAFLFSIVAMLFPNVFPAQFKTESGTVFVYFEATTVILTLVLLGQLLEARAHSRTSGAIKALLKLVPS